MTAGTLEASAAQPRPPGQPSNPPASTSGSPQASPAASSAASTAAMGAMPGWRHTGSAQGQSEWGRTVGPRQLSLYAGVGVVAGSQPHAEWQVRCMACGCDQVQGVVRDQTTWDQHMPGQLLWCVVVSRWVEGSVVCTTVWSCGESQAEPHKLLMQTVWAGGHGAV